MSKLEDLVPPLELCRKIPEGCFENSALVWRWNGNNGAIFERDGFPQEKYPAPTLLEIMDELARMEVCPSLIAILPVTGKVVYSISAGVNLMCKQGNNPAEAALKVWLELNKKVMENEQS